MTLTLTRPLIVFDCETTGQSPTQDRLVSLAFIQIRPPFSLREWSSYINPGIPIPKAATFGAGRKYPGHGITDTIVQGCRICGRCRDAHIVPPTGTIGDPTRACEGFRPWPAFRDLAENLVAGFSHCDFGGFNIKGYDLPLMRAEFERCGITWSYEEARILDGYRLWQVLQPRTLGDAVEYFLHRKHEGAHRAIDDVRATLALLQVQLQHLPENLAALHDLQWPLDPNQIDPDGKLIWKDGEAIFNFGKHRGVALKMVPKSYLDWVVNKAENMPLPFKHICTEALAGHFPTKEETC